MSILIRDAANSISYLTNYTETVTESGTGLYTWNFTVDGALPTLSSIKTPASDDLWVNTPTIGFNGSDVTATNLGYTFYINNITNTTGSNITSAITIQNASLTGLAEGGYYSIILEVADNVSNKLNSSARTFWYDGTAPTTATVTSLGNNTVLDNTTITLNLTDGNGQAYLDYVVYLNGTLNVSGSNGNNSETTAGALMSIALTGLADGEFYNLTIAVMDNASNTLNDSLNSLLFWYDSTEPTSSNIASPITDDSWAANPNIIFNGSDNVVLPTLNYTFYVNGTANVTGRNMSNSTATYAALTGLLEGGYYNITLEVENNVSKKLNSTARTLYYDATAPTTATVTSAGNNTVLDTTTVTLNLTDGNGQAYLDYAVYLNGTLNVSGSNGNNSETTAGALMSIALTGLADGEFYNLTIAVMDNASNTLNDSDNSLLFWYDSTGPTLSNITTPGTNDSWVANPNMIFNGTDNVMLPTLNYTLYIGGIANTTGRNLTGSGATYAALTGLAEGSYYSIILEVENNISMKLNSSPRTLWYDATAPTRAEVIGISNDTWVSSMDININVTDGAGQTLNYTIYVNGTLNVSNQANGSNGGSTSVSLTGLIAGGYYNVTVYAIDNASNDLNGSANVVTFWYDGTNPTTSEILSPATNGVEANSVNLQINGTDGVASAMNYTIYINGTANSTGYNLTNNILTYVGLTGLAEGGFYSIILEVVDNASNKLNSSARTFFYDGTGPQIIPTATNGTRTTSRTVSFWVMDNTRAVNLSSITVVGAGTGTGAVTSNGAFNYSSMCTLLTNGSNGYLCSYVENGLEPGAALLKIDGKDNASNSAASYYLEMNVTASTKFNKTLAAGWNLVSTPLVLGDSNIGNIVANNSNITSIYYYSGSAWTSWFSTSSDTLTTMEPLNGYWVYTSAATVMQFFGNTTTGTPARGYGASSPKSLSANTWYTIGYYSTTPGIDNLKTDDALTSLCAVGGLCSAGYANFDSLAWYDTGNSLLNSTLQSTWDEDAIWDRGAGFWIYMGAAETLTGTP